MNLDENISNAIKVLRSTYYNIEKLFSFLRAKASEYGYKCILKDNDIIMHRSKVHEPWSWAIGMLAILFQSNSDKIKFINGASTEEFFGVEICLQEDNGLPGLYVSKFNYLSDNIANWRRGFNTSDIWGITVPKWNEAEFDIKLKNGDVIYSVPRNDIVIQKYWGLKHALCKRSTYYDLTRENVYEKIFAVMDELKNFVVD